MARRIFEAFIKKGDVKVFQPKREWKQVKGSQTAHVVIFKFCKINKNYGGTTLDEFKKLDVFGFVLSIKLEAVKDVKSGYTFVQEVLNGGNESLKLNV